MQYIDAVKMQYNKCSKNADSTKIPIKVPNLIAGKTPEVYFFASSVQETF